MCIYIYAYIHTYIYIYRERDCTVRIEIYVYMYTYVCAYIYIYIYIYIYTYIGPDGMPCVVLWRPEVLLILSLLALRDGGYCWLRYCYLELLDRETFVEFQQEGTLEKLEFIILSSKN